jgi:hypothetical protein
MPPYPECFHRLILRHNADERSLVRMSMEVWGREAKHFASGLCVQAYPHSAKVKEAYSFGTRVLAKIKYGFIGEVAVVREVAWNEGMPGVEYRDDDRAVCIPITWME